MFANAYEDMGFLSLVDTVAQQSHLLTKTHHLYKFCDDNISTVLCTAVVRYCVVYCARQLKGKFFEGYMFTKPTYNY